MLCIGHVSISVGRGVACGASEGICGDGCVFAHEAHAGVFGTAPDGMGCVRFAGGKLCTQNEDQPAGERKEKCCAVQKTD